MTDVSNQNNELSDEIIADNQQEDDRQQETKQSITSYRFAGFWMRFWAFLVDLVVVSSINGIILSTIYVINDGKSINLGMWTLQGILSGIVFYLYFLLMTKKLGQTLGKMLFGIKVVRLDLQPLSWQDLIFREVVVRFCYKVFGFLQLLYLVVAFNPEKQGIHDMISDTTVVHVD